MVKNKKLNKVLRKFSYNKDLMDFIKILYPELLDYFKDEDIILDSLLSVRIILCERVDEYIGNDEYLSILASPEDVGDIDGIFFSSPNLQYDTLKKEFLISGVSRYILVKGDIKSDATKKALIHEICHLIKTGTNEFVIKHDTYVQRCGFTKITNQILLDEDKYSLETVFEDGKYLEEGFNELAAEEIGAKLEIEEGIDTEYLIPHQIANVIMNFNIPNIREKVIYAQLHHDYKDIENELGEGFFLFQDLADFAYVQTAMISQVDITKEERNKLYEDMLSYFENNHQEIIKKIREYRKSRER